MLDGANGGKGNLESGVGPVTLNNIVPNGSVVNAIIPNLTTSFSAELEADILDRISAYEEFGLRYDIDSETWKVITSTNLSTSPVFDPAKTGSNTETNADVEIVTNAPIPVGGTLQPFGSGKQVLQATDIVKVSATGAVDVSLSILEIT